MYNSNFSLNSLIDEHTFNLIKKQISHLFKFEVLILSSDDKLIGNVINPTYLSNLIKDSNLLTQIYINANEFTLRNFTSEITANNNFFGKVIVGQCKLENNFINYSSKIINFCKKNNIPENLIFEAFSKIPKRTSQDINTMKYCSEFIANYISQIISNKIKNNEISYLKNKQLKYIDTIKKIKIKDYNKENNSYFLFNTLNSISRMAFLENASHTEEMIYCLSDLLRYKFKQSENFTTIGSELENIKKYLFIQNIRYKNSLKYYIDIPKNILNYRIPPMIIEPMVEKIIFHGIESKIGEGFISIYGNIINNDIKIKIKYNDIYDSSNHHSTLLSCKNKPLEFLNANKRLVSYFGSNYGIEIFNADKGETLIEIKIPCFKEILFDNTKERNTYNVYYYDC
ncbi:histidine kinase [Clostridium tarantellae]|nr:histidine kinase [Clostridium tarantellae]